MPSRDLEIFLRQLATLSQAGVPMEQGLRAIAPQLVSPFNRLAISVADDVAQGCSLYQSANRHQQQFDVTTLALIRVGELSGRLADLLTHAANLVEKRRAILNGLFAKLAYPTLLYHLLFIIPSLGKWLFPQAEFVPAWFILGLLPFYLIVVSVVILNQQRHHSVRLDQFVMRLPLIGSLSKAWASINFSRCLQAYILAGANLREAILDCAPATGSPCAVEDLALAKEKIANGENLSNSLNHCRFLTATSRSLIATGEQSGALVEMLEKNARLLDEEFTRKITVLTFVLSGIVFGVAVILIGWLVISVFGGYYNQLNQLENGL